MNREVLVESAKEKARELASRKAEHYKHLADKYRDQASSLDKWALAALLSTNGGALICAISLTMISENEKIVACSFFSCGIVIAIIRAIILGDILQDLYFKIEEAVDHLEKIAGGDDPDFEFFDRVSKSLKQKTIPATFVDVANYFSLLTFVLGAFVVGVHFK